MMRKSTIFAALTMCLAAVANLTMAPQAHADELGCKSYCAQSCWAPIFACLVNCDSGVRCEETACIGVSGNEYPIDATCNTTGGGSEV